MEVIGHEPNCPTREKRKLFFVNPLPAIEFSAETLSDFYDSCRFALLSSGF